MNNINIHNLPYRDNISCIVFKNSRFLLVQLIDWPDNFWKFPQGGLNKNEKEDEAARRELNEELGTDKFKIIGKSVHKNKYDWDGYSIKLAGYRWRGQIQKFLIIEFLGSDQDIKLDRKEIQRYKWVERKDLGQYIGHDHPIFSNYKRTVYKILTEFKSTFRV